MKTSMILSVLILVAGATYAGSAADVLKDVSKGQPVGSVVSPTKSRRMVVAKGKDSFGAAVWVWIVPYKIQGTPIYYPTKIQSSAAKKLTDSLQEGWYFCDVRGSEIPYRFGGVDHVDVNDIQNCSVVGLR
jgi:hypothetical protein